MSDERTPAPADRPDATQSGTVRQSNAGSGSSNRADYRAEFQRNFASRLFPGPSKEMSPQYAEHLDRLLKQAGAAQAGRRRPDASSSTTAVARTTAATAEDISQLRDSLDKQNELLQALLATSVDTQTDARSTAQNSRTFAWAGTAIALLTLIATVISIVAAIKAG